MGVSDRDYANTRYSTLKQITTKTSPAGAGVELLDGCCAATKARRCARDVMYIHTPFPNIVYALDLNHDGKILWNTSRSRSGRVP